MTTPQEEFTHALETEAHRYGLPIGEREIAWLGVYYEQIQAWNSRLHLVAPCSPTEFAVRHVLESLVAVPHLTASAHVIDIGSGAGLPILPCLIARPSLTATLIEASPKKAIFLRETLRRLKLNDAVKVINERFEKTVAPEADFITCRALERFTEMIPTLIEWSSPLSTLLLFGGPALHDAIAKLELACTSIQLLESEQRFLFIIKRALC